MAIKGKRKTRGRRVVAAPPRATLVVRKPPLWQRRWVWATVGGIAAAAITTVVLVKLHHSHAEAVKASERQAVESFTDALVKRFPSDRTLIQPDVIELYPNLGTDLTNLRDGRVKAADAETEGARVSASATKAAGAVSGMNVSKFFPSTFEVTGDRRIHGHGATIAAMQDAQFLMAHGFRLYSAAGELMKEATTTNGETRAALVQQAQTVLSEATSLFDKGYRQVLQLRQALGLGGVQASSGTPSTPLPTVGPTPNASPSAAPTPAIGGSPTPSASPSG